MEPVGSRKYIFQYTYISILRLRMEPVAMFFDYLIMYSLFLSSGSAWSLSRNRDTLSDVIGISILRLRMEPVKDFDLLNSFSDISILRLRMEPVNNFASSRAPPSISILRLRMEPVLCCRFYDNFYYYFYPQAPHGACHCNNA